MPYPAQPNPVPNIPRLRAMDRADFVALTTSSPEPTIFVQGAVFAGDGGEGNWRWAATSTATDDGAMVVAATNSGLSVGRWLRVFTGSINVQWYGARGDDNTDDTAALQAAINAAGGYGRELYFPPGVYIISSALVFYRDPDGLAPFEETALRGAGRTSSVIQGNFIGPMITWQNGTFAACMRIENLTIDNAAAGGTCLTWFTNNPDVDRLQLACDHVDFNFRGNVGSGAAPDIYCVDITGGLKCNFSDVNINGGAKSPATWIGWAIRLKSCSQCTFVSLFFASGAVGRGMLVEGGGNNVWFHTRIDSGSRNQGASFHFLNTTRSSVYGLRGEGTDDNPFLKIEGCTALTFIDAGIPANGYSGPQGDMVSIVGSKGINFIGGCIADQASAGGLGRGLRIDATSDFIKADRLLMAHAAENIVIADRTKDIALDVLDNLNDYTQPNARLTFGGATSGASYTRMLTASSALWDPPSLAAAASTTTTVTVAGAVPGNLVGVRWRPNQTWAAGMGASWRSLPWQMLITGVVTSNNTVTVTLYNNTGAVNDMGDGYADVTVWQTG